MFTERKVVSVTVASLILIVLQVTYGQEVPLEFGKPCDPSSDLCDVSKHLICGATNTCICNGETTLYYNVTSGQCTAYAGTPCSEGSGFPISCTSNARCKAPGLGQPGVCECDFGFMKASNGRCLLSHGLSGCLSQGDCNQDAFLTCSFGTCLCQLNNATHQNQVWDENGDNSTCRSLVGVDCTRNTPCVENSECANNRTCSCENGFEANLDGYCTKGVGQTCSTNSECSSNNCVAHNSTTPAGVCRCPENEMEVDEKCYVLPGRSCEENRNCGTNADCVLSPNERICRCREGFSQAGDLCLANYNSTCTVMADPEDDICNGDIYLVCRNETSNPTGRCDCSTGYAYNSSLGRCQAGFGADCALDRELDCIFSTTCVTNVPGVSKCQCQQGLVKGEKENVCRAPHGGGPCDLYSCYEFDHHVCNASTNACSCESDNLDPNPSGNCLAKVDTPCNIQDQQKPLYCIQLAVCTTEGPNVEDTICKCPTQYHPSENKTMCLIGNGSGTLSISAIAISTFFVLVRLL